MQSNRIELTGYLAARPEGRHLPSGTPVANARLGQTHQYSTSDGLRKNTNWFSLTFYGELSAVATTYDKGDNIHVVGSMRQRQFTPKDGSTRTVHEVIVQRCHRVDRHGAGPVHAVGPLPDEGSESSSEEPPGPGQEQADAWSLL